MVYNSAAYVKARQKYTRPQAMLWSENPGSLIDDGNGNNYYVPIGYEQGSSATDYITSGDFIILSDQSRSPISFKINRIENRKRTVNGRMRSNHVADKIAIDVSWSELPSRSTDSFPNFETTLENTLGQLADGVYSFTVDGGAGGTEMLEWYESHTGSFWVFLAYDKLTNFPGSQNAYGHLKEYNQIIEMYITSFSYTVQKRGGNNYDFWNISVSLEEV